MTGPLVAILVAQGLWIGALTLVVVLCVRQIGLLTVRFDQSGGSFSLEDDGPEVGGGIPAEVATILPGSIHGARQLLLVSATCTPCRDLAEQLRSRELPASVIALVPGPPELADGMVALLPPGIQVIQNPEASSIASALHISSTPFAVAIDAGIVTGKQYLHSVDDFMTFVADGANGGTRKSRQLEVSHGH